MRTRTYLLFILLGVFAFGTASFAKTIDLSNFEGKVGRKFEAKLYTQPQDYMIEFCYDREGNPTWDLDRFKGSNCNPQNKGEYYHCSVKHLPKKKKVVLNVLGPNNSKTPMPGRLKKRTVFNYRSGYKASPVIDLFSGTDDVIGMIYATRPTKSKMKGYEVAACGGAPIDSVRIYLAAIDRAFVEIQTQVMCREYYSRSKGIYPKRLKTKKYRCYFNK